MTNLADFLKCKKVRCILDHAFLTVRNEYTILSISAKHIEVLDDANEEIKIDIDFFEPVLETAIEASDSLDSTPMGTRTVNEFEVEDRVYKGIDGKIFIVIKNQENGYVDLRDLRNEFFDPYVCVEKLCHATPENHEMLCKLYQYIEFEKPKQELTGSDLCRAMLDKGWKYVVCDVNNDPDYTHDIRVIYDYKDGFLYSDDGNGYQNVLPIDPKTGEPLTSEVLDD